MKWWEWNDGNEMMGMKWWEWNDGNETMRIKLSESQIFVLEYQLEWNTSFNKVNLENNITKSWMKGRDYLNEDLYYKKKKKQSDKDDDDDDITKY